MAALHYRNLPFYTTPLISVLLCSKWMFQFSFLFVLFIILPEVNSDIDHFDCSFLLLIVEPFVSDFQINIYF